ncbi:MAG TPA: D-alanyl-D-alanine carboxypeptidase [Firmicutes bacterium]|nr:D-alanyl-D-alanine carboxypeptidase [Bacillota bacterium]
MLKKIMAVFICCALIVPIVAMADTAEILSENITTEYLSDDLLEPYSDASVEAETVLELNAKSAVLMEKSTGRVLYEQNPHERLAPASITKIMSLLLIMEAIESGKITIDDTVSASEHAVSMGGSQIWLEVGETMTVNELLKAVAIGSANDATVALGEYIAGSEEAFVNMMNERAAQLGMENTHFVNCTGLDAENHYTSAYDVALMSRELIGHDLIKQYSSVWMDSLREGETQLVNTNKLVRFYEGATGLKTGTTDEAGYCLSATAERDDMELIAVVMGSDSGNNRFNSARKLLDHGFANYVKVSPAVDMSEIPAVKVTGGVESLVPINEVNAEPVLITKGKEKSITAKIELPESIEAPISAGQQIGTVSIMQDDEMLAQIPITAAKDIGKMTFTNALWLLIQKLFGV